MVKRQSNIPLIENDRLRFLSMPLICPQEKENSELSVIKLPISYLKRKSSYAIYSPANQASMKFQSPKTNLQ